MTERYRRELSRFADETEPSELDMEIARARWDAARLERVRRPSQGFTFATGALFASGLAAAAALLLFSLRADPTADGPARLGGGAPVDLALSEGMQIQGNGVAVLTGPPGDREVELSEGALRFEVEPNQGLHLEVRTEEGVARVLGTVFTVERGELGTRVSVERGKVEVACAGSEPLYLTAGGEGSCRSALGYLKQGLELQEGGSAPEAVLSAISPARLLPADDAVRADLELLSINSLNSKGDFSQALSRIDAYLGDPGMLAASPEGREVELQLLAARAAIKAGGCELALPRLAALQGRGAEATEYAQYAACVRESDPEAARAALKTALEMGLEPSIAERIRRMLGE